MLQPITTLSLPLAAFTLQNAEPYVPQSVNAKVVMSTSILSGCLPTANKEDSLELLSQRIVNKVTISDK